MSESLNQLGLEIEAYADAKATRNQVLTKRQGQIVQNAIQTYTNEVINQYKSEHEKNQNVPSDSASSDGRVAA